MPNLQHRQIHMNRIRSMKLLQFYAMHCFEENPYLHICS